MSKSLYQKLGITKSELINQLDILLHDDWSLPQIAEKYNTSSTTIYNYCKSANLNRRANLRDPSWLYNEYIINKLSMADISKMCGVTYQAVDWHLKKNNIPQRNMSQAQQIAQVKRNDDILLRTEGTRIRSRGYCIRYDGLYLRSAQEYLWYKMNKSKHDISYEPFIYKNYKPDFLVDKETVIEIKSKKINYTVSEINEYISKGKGITSDLGYEYKLIFMTDEYPKEVSALLNTLRSMGATPGFSFSLINEI